ncbi:DUF389 domain-containing protein [Conexibacter sp. W3-3-2]|uniref:DUF389 domain-containing protein n=1 Tax=Conexibacter sp. W3-3-2 TaxID=2675227 RepID=UPI0013289ACB|nr:DUF389 domain-containing protein [Conexibacter sp. W3-3-2]MTD43342.1 DUF389 domain-containing protein [Conexibacter sp. W3-3-2]
MVHLRLVVPHGRVDDVLEVLECTPAVTSIIVLPGAARSPVGDVVLCDVAREDASVVLSDLRRLRIDEDGSIAVEIVDTALSRVAEEAERIAPGSPSDAVIWEDVEAKTSESATLSGVYLTFMVLASLIAAVGIFLDSPILIVGAMVVGPEFGPIAGFSVAFVQWRQRLALKSLGALLVGFPVAIVAAYLASQAFRLTGVTPDVFSEADHNLSSIISNPDFLAFFVAACAGAAGVLSLTTQKSGALIGVLISVTTIPAAANIGITAAYEDWDGFSGSVQQLAVNVAGILLAGVVTLYLQRKLYHRRRRRHLASVEVQRAARLRRRRR